MLPWFGRPTVRGKELCDRTVRNLWFCDAANASLRWEGAECGAVNQGLVSMDGTGFRVTITRQPFLMAEDTEGSGGAMRGEAEHLACRGGADFKS